MDIAHSFPPSLRISSDPSVIDLRLRPEEAMQYYGLLSDGQGVTPPKVILDGWPRFRNTRVSAPIFMVGAVPVCGPDGLRPHGCASKGDECQLSEINELKSSK